MVVVGGRGGDHDSTHLQITKCHIFLCVVLVLCRLVFVKRKLYGHQTFLHNLKNKQNMYFMYVSCLNSMWSYQHALKWMLPVAVC